MIILSKALATDLTLDWRLVWKSPNLFALYDFYPIFMYKHLLNIKTRFGSKHTKFVHIIKQAMASRYKINQ